MDNRYESIKVDYELVPLIDWTAISYQIASVSEYEDSFLVVAQKIKDFIVNRIYQRIPNVTKRLFVIDGESIFRYNFNKDYKNNRKGKPKPRWFNELMILGTQMDAVKHPNLEADDYISIVHNNFEKQFIEGDIKFRTIIVSGDKDMKQNRGYIFVPSRHQYGKEHGDYFMYIDPVDAEKWLWKQMIMGDPADGLSGIKNKGIEATNKIVDSEPVLGRMSEIVREMYNDCYKENGELEYERMFKSVYIHKDFSYFKSCELEPFNIPEFTKIKPTDND